MGNAPNWAYDVLRPRREVEREWYSKPLYERIWLQIKHKLRLLS